MSFEDRERVIEAIVHEPGNREQVVEGLTALADLDSGDCLHPPGSPDTCVTCLARRFLAQL